jgi:hypothetical protein
LILGFFVVVISWFHTVVIALPELQDQEDEFVAEGLEKYLLNKMYKECYQPRGSDDKFRDEVVL